jgi:hypothetical protein
MDEACVVRVVNNGSKTMDLSALLGGGAGMGAPGMGGMGMPGMGMPPGMPGMGMGMPGEGGQIRQALGIDSPLARKKHKGEMIGQMEAAQSHVSPAHLAELLGTTDPGAGMDQQLVMSLLLALLSGQGQDQAGPMPMPMTAGAGAPPMAPQMMG